MACTRVWVPVAVWHNHRLPPFSHLAHTPTHPHHHHQHNRYLADRPGCDLIHRSEYFPTLLQMCLPKAHGYDSPRAFLLALADDRDGGLRGRFVGKLDVMPMTGSVPRLRNYFKTLLAAAKEEKDRRAARG